MKTLLESLLEMTRTALEEEPDDPHLYRNSLRKGGCNMGQLVSVST